MSSNTKVFNKAYVTYSTLFAALLMLVQIFCMFKFATGISYFYGTKITVVTVVELLFGVFYTMAYYRGIAGTLIAIFYIVSVVVMIKNLV